KAARKRKGGGILYEMSSKEGADWLKQPDVLKVFTKCYDAKATVRGATYPFFADFVPVAFQAQDFDERRKVEEDSGLPRYALDDIRWMKPVGKREQNQKVATLKIFFSSPVVAN
ncbi:hypothetical protein SCHPADRAFT_793342, partial [Schizopora paradoxa]